MAKKKNSKKNNEASVVPTQTPSHETEATEETEVVNGNVKDVPEMVLGVNVPEAEENGELAIPEKTEVSPAETEPKTPEANLQRANGVETQEILALHARIAELTQKLETAPSGVSSDARTIELEEKLRQSEATSEQHKSNYDVLYNRLTQVKHILVKSKQVEAELEEARTQLDTATTKTTELEARCATVSAEKEASAAALAAMKQETTDLNTECDRLSHDLAKLRREYQLRDDSATQEKDSLVSSNHKLAKKIEEMKAAREDSRVVQLEEQATVKELQSQMDEFQAQSKAKDVEISILTKEKTESQNHIAFLEKKITDQDMMMAQTAARNEQTVLRLQEQLVTSMNETAELSTKIEQASGVQTLLDEALKDSHNKQLQIGKLRHEAIILNEHLTKALKLIKKDHESENVDKQLITNLFLQFLAIQRGDKKKFQVLQLISGILGWDEQQQQQAGLVGRVGVGAAGEEREGRVRESFVSLWTEFLDKESRAK